MPDAAPEPAVGNLDDTIHAWTRYLGNTIGHAMRNAPPVEVDILLGRVADALRAHVETVRETLRRGERPTG